jgi:dethiobiotin synthetase
MSLGASVPPSVFVCGTDTGVGKTLVSATLIRASVRAGFRAFGMKPVAAGVMQTPEGPQNDDLRQLRAAGHQPPPDPSWQCPYVLPDPLSPHLAARRIGVTIQAAPILGAFRRLQQHGDLVVVEGVGGFRVPFSDTYDSAQMACDLNLPVILVVGLRLGCLNHALLTAEAIQHRGLTMLGWVGSGIDPHMAAQQENISTLSDRLPAPCLGVLPFCANPVADHLTTALDLRPWFDMPAVDPLP